MATQVEKLQKVKEIKTSIKDVINANGGNVGEVFSEYPLAIETLLTGGGSDSPKGQYRIRYFDIDGTVLKEEYLDSGATLTPPKAPNYDSDYLVFDSWNYDIENTVVDGPLDIGAIYNTIDNCTYMFCRFTTNTGLNPTLAISGSPTIDWGDGTVNTSLSHTYASEGEYVIKISGSFSFNTSLSKYLMGSSSLNNAILKGYFSNVEKFTNYCFQQSYIRIISLPKNYDYSTFSPYEGFKYCIYLEYITIPNLVTTIGQGMFDNCSSLTNISIPNSVTTILGNAFKRCSILESIAIPNSVTSIGSDFLYNCYTLNKFNIPKYLNSISANFITNSYALENISIPNSVTSIGINFLTYCYKLKNIIISENVTSIGSAFLSGCYLLKNVFILCETVLTVGVNLLQTASNDFTIWVNDSIIDSLKVATNWSTYASYMKKLSECPQDLLDENGIEL